MWATYTAKNLDDFDFMFVKNNVLYCNKQILSQLFLNMFINYDVYISATYQFGRKTYS